LEEEEEEEEEESLVLLGEVTFRVEVPVPALITTSPPKPLELDVLFPA
jgi:hypothetical protein